MWDERGLFEHSLRKKETRQIINKIEVKHYLEMRKSHSEGSEVASDYAMQLRHAVRKSKTQKLTFLQKQHLRKRLITQFSQRSRVNTAQLQFNQISMPDENVQKVEEVQQIDQQDEEGKNVKNAGSNIKIEVQDSFQYEQSNDRQLQLDVRKSEQSLSPTQVQLKHMGRSKKHFLPMLELYIQQLNSLKTMSAHQKSIRNIIVTMMVLAINRRQNGSLLEALDILLQTEIYFPRENKQMIHLKSVWLSLIGKIYQQIKKSFKNDNAKNRWKKTTRKSSVKTNLQAKRQKTIFIRSLASRKAFFDKFSQNLRKSKLIFESTYMMELTNEQNTLKIDNGYMVVSKTNSQFIVSFHEPRHVFPESENIVNYAIIMINKDKEANLFPFNYPQSLAGFVSKHDYTNKIMKINSYLLPMARCMNFSSALSINFEFILCILIILLIATIMLIVSYSRTTIAVAITVFIIFLLFASSKIHSRIQSKMGQAGQVNQKMQKCCKQWEEDYNQLEIKFLLDSNCDMFLISFPIDEDQPEEQSSSNSLCRHETKQKKQKTENQMSRKCSIKLQNPSFINPLDQINENSSDDNEPNAQFWKQIQKRAENDVEMELNRQFEEQLSQQSQDEVMRVLQKAEDCLEVQLIAVKAKFCPDLQ